jgi:hypothetical protein
MNRRKAIGRIVLGVAAGGAIFSGYKWYDWHKAPDFRALEQHHDTLAALAETILPATPDAPGAKEAGIADYIIIMVRDCTDRMSANKFIDGLKALDGHCRSAYGQPFETCTPAQQVGVMQQYEENGRPAKGLLGKAENKYLGRSFFTTLKQYTVKGYCTSQLGATKGLTYVPVPGSYHGCIPKLPGQRAWATN